MKSNRTLVILLLTLGNLVLGVGSAFSKEVRDVPLVPSQLFSCNERSMPYAVGDFGGDPYKESFPKRFNYSIESPILTDAFITSDGRSQESAVDGYTVVCPSGPWSLYFWSNFMSSVYSLLRWTKLIAG